VRRRIPIVLLAAVLSLACARERGVTRLSSDDWRGIDAPDQVRMERVLPPGEHRFLAFRAYGPELSVRVDGVTVYSYREPASGRGLTIHVVPLPRGSGGKTIEIVAPGRDEVVGAVQALTSAPTPSSAIDAVAYAPLREDAFSLAVGFAFTTLGLVALIAAAVRRRGDTATMVAFGVFVVLYGVRDLATSHLALAMGLSLPAVRWIESVITHVIAIPAWILPLRLIGRGWHSLLYWQVVAFAVFAPVGLLTDIVRKEPGSLSGVNNVLVILAGANVFLHLLQRRYRTEELRVVFVATIVMMLFAFNSNLAALGVLPWDFDEETPGFVVFVAGLGIAATRAFIRTEKERDAIDSELRTAREIQQSILPSSMPAVEGLAFAAGYVPATAVAGDVYDFIATGNDRAGVIVADVAGHGVPAALIASMVKIAASSQAHLAADPGAMLAQLSSTLRRDVRRAFVTATYLYFDMTRREVHVANAGHPPPWLCRRGECRELGGQGVVLGRFRDTVYPAQSAGLESGDRIVAFTDGALEARNTAGEQFGEERLRAVIRGAGERDAQEAVTAIVDAVRAWRAADDPDADDLTLVVVDVR
jgi:sigma-B regulation protein RsbU (phosphoserine phosphatase)